MLDILMTHSIARREGKPPFFFSRFNFVEMQLRGNTHFCFACLSKVGFTPGPTGEPTNHLEKRKYNGMEDHDETHANFILGNANKYDNPWEWLEHEMSEDFPCIVSIPQI